jgi:beta-lactam-binding protein with PASTA domain
VDRAVGEPRPGAVTLWLRRLEADEGTTAPIEIEVRPGERATLIALIRNESEVVDNYDLSVTELPDGWWRAEPPTAYLVPFGTGGTYEQEIQIHVEPPRTPDARAKPWPFEVVAFSRAFQAQVAEAPATVRIVPYQDVSSKVSPDRASGRLKARFLLTVRNRANAPAEVLVDAEDAEGECRVRFASASVTVDPGTAVEAPFTVIPPKQIWIGRAKDRQIKVTASSIGDERGQPPPPVTFRQRSWLPWWLAVVAPLVAAAAVLALLLLPKQTTVPDLTHKNFAAAQKLLFAAGLKPLLPIGQVNAPGVPTGLVVVQRPPAGQKVKRGSAVLIDVAVGPSKVPVPNLVGVTVATATQELHDAHLQLGTVSPPNENGNIVSQYPAANSPLARGATVNVFLPPPAPASQSSTTTTTGSSTGSAKPATTAKSVVLPVITGNPQVAAQSLFQLGFVPTSGEQFSPSAPGKLVGTSPPPGTSVPAGGKVELIVSAGWPKLSYDDGSTIYLAGPPGTPAKPLPASGQHQDEASWSPDGSSLVYVQGPASSGQLFSVAAKQPGALPIALTTASSDDHDPAFAPTKTQNVLAYIDESAAGSKLCFGIVGPNPVSPSCTSRPGWTLGRQVAWSPDGTKILVFGTKDGSNGNVFGLIEFVSNQRFSPQASLWGQGSVVTDIAHPGRGVIAGAFSPDGNHVALVSNIGTDGFYLFVGPANDFELKAPAKALGVPGCRVAWRPDSQELAVMQADSACRPSILGTIFGVNPSAPGTSTRIATQAEDPAWQPLSLGG